MVRCSAKLRDMNVVVSASDERSIEVLASGLPLHGAQLAIDFTLRSALTSCGSAIPGAASENGAALARACPVVVASLTHTLAMEAPSGAVSWPVPSSLECRPDPSSSSSGLRRTDTSATPSKRSPETPLVRWRAGNPKSASTNLPVAVAWMAPTPGRRWLVSLSARVSCCGLVCLPGKQLVLIWRAETVPCLLCLPQFPLAYLVLSHQT